MNETAKTVQLQDFVPHMAKEYGFDYEMITYKWPSWLRAQHEKQRTIWGYKILFLDVLFPLSLDKVIFVDADQVGCLFKEKLVTCLKFKLCRL